MANRKTKTHFVGICAQATCHSTRLSLFYLNPCGIIKFPPGSVSKPVSRKKIDDLEKVPFLNAHISVSWRAIVKRSGLLESASETDPESKKKFWKKPGFSSGQIPDFRVFWESCNSYGVGLELRFWAHWMRREKWGRAYALRKIKLALLRPEKRD